MSVSKDEKLDRDHVAVVDQPTPEEIVGEPQYNLQPETGSEDERSVKVTSKSTLGRHVTSEHGFDVGRRRHRHNKQQKRQAEKVFGK